MRWPVLDHGLTLSTLHAEATDDLAEELEQKRLVAWGPVEFRLEGVDTGEGERLELHASVEVRPLGPHHGKYLPRSKRRDAAA